MDVKLVNTAIELEQCCEHLAQQRWIAVDTEFMREKTYYPQLCLTQIASTEHIYCIDMLAIDDTQSLQKILVHGDITKVFHACRQDLEVLNLLGGLPPSPVFDSQIAAGLLGFDDQLGYAALIEAITGTVLPKGHQRTDWSRRPFADDQIAYAANDVRYLSDIYSILLDKLNKLDRLHWLQEDCERLTDPALYAGLPALAYLRIKQGHALSPTQQQVLKSLAQWREQVAQKKDRPRNWIARDSLLIHLAQNQPENLDQLHHAKGLADGTHEKQGKAILAAIAAGLAENDSPVYEAVGPLTSTQTRLRDHMMKALKAKAEALGIRPTLLAARREVDIIARGSDSSSLLNGWRRDVIGKELLLLRDSGVV